MKKTAKYFLIILFLIIGSIVTYLILKKTYVIKPDIKRIKNLTIKKITNSHIESDIEILAANSNIFNFEIEKMTLYILHSKDTIGIINSNTTISLLSSNQTELKLPLLLETNKVAALLSKDLDTIKINLIGIASIKLIFFRSNSTINTPFNLPLKESIFNTIQEDTKQEKIIRIKHARLDKIGFNNSHLLIDFSLKNPYDINFTLVDFPSEVFINNKFAGEGSLKYPIPVDTTDKSTDGTFVFKLNNLETFRSLFNSLFTRKISYTTKGVLLLEILNHKVRLPFSFSGEIE